MNVRPAVAVFAALTLVVVGAAGTSYGILVAALALNVITLGAVLVGVVWIGTRLVWIMQERRRDR